MTLPNSHRAQRIVVTANHPYQSHCHQRIRLTPQLQRRNLRSFVPGDERYAVLGLGTIGGCELTLLLMPSGPRPV